MRTQRELANAIRVLSVDAIQCANSGHPGMPLGMADIAEVLWNNFLKHNPKNPNWLNRDRFVLSNGHGSMLQYALLHLSGYELSIEDLKQFRQLNSKTPGHPEYGATPGVETTTGPLGQGLAAAVGMALAEQLLASSFNVVEENESQQYDSPLNIIDHYTYCFVGDGCLMEGISHEACSLAGTLSLHKLIVFWDDNGISIDGKTDAWFSESVPQRFRAYNWQVIEVDGHAPQAINDAILAAQADEERPTLICCKTVIGFGSPQLAGTAACHGSPLGKVEIAALREKLNWQAEEFSIPADIYQAWDAKQRGGKLENEWNEKFAEYAKQYPELAVELHRRLQSKLPSDWSKTIANIIKRGQEENANLATRKASQKVLEQITELLPELFGGSADLSCSNLTKTKFSKSVQAGIEVKIVSDVKNEIDERETLQINQTRVQSTQLIKTKLTGNYLDYGVREFAMAGIMNGIALYGGFIPYGGTFLVFADYARSAIRMSALMQQRVIYVLTHDSIGLGEDGPTHQPIEHLSMLRLTPNLTVWRPCDAVETAVAWQMAIENQNGPTVLALTRQKVAGQLRSVEQSSAIKRGGYILKDCAQPEVILLATGSEVELAMQASVSLQKQGTKVRVVSMPAVEVFLAQDAVYQQQVLPAGVPKVAIEAGATALWYRFVGTEGKVIGIDRYGESAPGAEVYQALGLDLASILLAVEKCCGN